MKLYVAAKYEEWPTAQMIANMLEAQGHSITCKWWEFEDFELSREPEKGMAAAVRDVVGVQEADAVVALMQNDLPYKGVYGEFTAALVLAKPVYVIGKQHKKFVFGYHPLVRDISLLPKGA